MTDYAYAHFITSFTILILTFVYDVLSRYEWCTGEKLGKLGDNVFSAHFDSLQY